MFFFQQAEDLRDLDDKENSSLRKEQAPLLEPLEPKDVNNTLYLNNVAIENDFELLICFRFLATKHRTSTN